MSAPLGPHIIPENSPFYNEIKTNVAMQKDLEVIQQVVSEISKNLSEHGEYIDQQHRDLERAEIDIKKIADQNKSVLFHLEQAFWLTISRVAEFILWIIDNLTSLFSTNRDMSGRNITVLSH